MVVSQSQPSQNPTAEETPLISADSHIFEPGNLWLERTARKFHDRVPKIVSVKEGDTWEYDGGQTMAFAGFATAGDWKGRTSSFMRVEDLRPAIFDPIARMEEARLDGIRAEVLYPSFAMRLFGSEDPEFQFEVMRAYNDWLIEYCSADPDRLLPHAMIPSLDVEAAIREVRRTAKLGFRGFLINAHPRLGRDYGTTLYEGLWSAIEESGLPASLHLYAGDTEPKRFDPLAIYSVDPGMIQRSLALIVFTGVLERHPGLRLIVVESDVGWVAHLLTRMDHVFQRKGPRFGTALKSGLLPSELFKRQISCVLTEDRAGILTLEITGADIYMWGSDYPHNDSTWPNSQRTVERVFSGVPQETRRAILAGNAARLYGLDVD